MVFKALLILFFDTAEAGIITLMKLIIVRHGETEGNVKKIIQSKEGGKLTDKGRKQAKELGRQLKEKFKIDMVFCSPMSRCQETLEGILSEYPISGEILMSSLLKEREFGEYEGVEDCMIDWKEVNKDSKLNQEMGVESWSELGKRIGLFLEDLKLENNEKSTVLVISHGDTIRAMVNKVTKQELRYPERVVKNAEIIELDFDTSLDF